MASEDLDLSAATLVPTTQELTGDVLEPGTTAGSYTIQELLGRGGCGTVYLATRASDGARAAVKVLHRYLAAEPSGVERFLREVRAVTRIRHPSIIEVHEVGQLAGGRPYFAMELLDGMNLRRLLQLQGRLSPVECHEVLQHVCAALGAAHAAGIVHRDVKAENIVMCDDRRVKLLDFGIAKLLEPDPGAPGLTTTQQLIGTPVAMAPEQLRCLPVDQRTDVYGVGVLAYHMLTGAYPFRGDAEAVARMHLESPPRPPSSQVLLPPALDAVVLRCLEKQPGARYPTAEAVAQAFREALFGAELPTRSRGAVALLVRADAPEGLEDDEALEAAAAALDGAEAMLRAAGLEVPVQTSSELLAVQLLPLDPVESLAARGRAIELGRSVHGALGASFPALRVAVTVHAGDVYVRGESGEITGGPLLEISAWSWPHEGLLVTQRAGADLPPM
jgi:eukaryotic-like serine/threonine-protein kinase